MEFNSIFVIILKDKKCGGYVDSIKVQGGMKGKTLLSLAKDQHCYPAPNKPDVIIENISLLFF
jgi:hypothetical protein